MRFVTLVTIISLAIQSALAATITFPAEVTVRGDKVLLGQIATIDGTEAERARLKDIELDTAPGIGQSRLLSLGIIRVQLRHADIDLNSITIDAPSAVKITRAATDMDGQSLVTIAQEWLATEMPATDDEEIILTPVRTPSNISLPDGQLTWKCTPAGSSIGTMRYVMLEVKVDDKTAWRGMISFKVKRIAQVLVAKRAIGRGTAVTETNVALEKRDISSLTAAPIREIADISGYCAATSISSGAILTMKQLELIPLVKRNDRVRVRATCGAVTVTLVGIACEDGVKGETIRVRNIQSREEFVAYVTGPGELALEL